MSELITDELVEATAEALRRYDTSGLCPLRGACELCDCGMDAATPAQIETLCRQALDRARYALEAVAPLLARRDEGVGHALAEAQAQVERVRALIAPQWRSFEYDRNALIDDLRAALDGEGEAP